MKTVLVKARRACQIIEKPMPTIRRNYALVKVVVAPMCNDYLAYKDFIFLQRNRPDSLGHEVAGEVVDCSPGSSVRVGQRVVGLVGFSCGRCSTCRRGYYAHCPHPDDPCEVCNSASGECGFAQYAIKPDWMLVPIPDSLSYEHASMACCGLGSPFYSFERIGVDAFSTVLVTGLGAAGLGCVINAKYRGAKVIGIARSPYRTKLAKALGCDVVLDPSETDIAEAIKDLTHGSGVDSAFECSGQLAYRRLAIENVGCLGSVSFLAEQGEFVLHVEDDIVVRGMSFIGGGDVILGDTERLFDMIAAIPEQIETLVTHRYSIDEIAAAFERQISGECGKLLLYPWN